MADLKFKYKNYIWVKNADDNYAFVPWDALKSIALNKHEAIIYYEGGTLKFNSNDAAYQIVKNYFKSFNSCERLIK